MAVNAPKNETQLQYHNRRKEELRTVRGPWEPWWAGLAEHVEPTRYRGVLQNEGPISRKSIIDSTATYAWRILKSGMHSGITSPARPWFRLTTSDPDLKDFAPVKLYLSNVERRMREIFASSNIYPSFHTGYGDLGLFGQSVGLLVEDDDTILRMIQLIHGSFWIARDDKGQVTTLYRRFRWSVQRIVQRFGLKGLTSSAQTAWDGGRYSALFDVWQAVEPRLNRDPRKPDKKNKRFLSNYWLDGATENDGGLLEESGFDENPIIGPAWELTEDDYATSPGGVIYGDARMLQREQARKLEGIDKKVRPPMTGPTSMRNNPASLLPGAVTYVDDPAGKGFRPAMEVTLQLNDLKEDIRDVQQRIKEGFYSDLFLAITQMEGVQPRNQFELAERKEEKLLALGPVLENIYSGQLRPAITRSYAIMERQGELPPLPRELENQGLKIEYISVLAQAQKAVATGSIERLWGFAGQVAAVKPEVLDKLDADQSIDEYGDMLGAPPSVIVPDDKVEKIRADRAQQQRTAQAAELASQVAPAAKDGADAAAVLATAQENQGGASLLNQLGLA